MTDNVRSEENAGEETGESPLLRLALDFGPLLIFFGVNWKAGLFWATGIFMVAITIALIISRVVTGKVAAMPLITAAFVLVFGGLTLYLQNETFIKVKPTIIYLLFAAALTIGQWLDREPLKLLLGQAFDLTDVGWRILTYRWAAFFVFLALTNEVVWRNVSNDTWVTFKVFGFLPLTLVFAMMQVGLIQKHGTQDAESES